MSGRNGPEEKVEIVHAIVVDDLNATVLIDPSQEKPVIAVFCGDDPISEALVAGAVVTAGMDPRKPDVAKVIAGRSPELMDEHEATLHSVFVFSCGKGREIPVALHVDRVDELSQRPPAGPMKRSEAMRGVAEAFGLDRLLVASLLVATPEEEEMFAGGREGPGIPCILLMRGGNTVAAIGGVEGITFDGVMEWLASHDCIPVATVTDADAVKMLVEPAHAGGRVVAVFCDGTALSETVLEAVAGRAAKRPGTSVARVLLGQSPKLTKERGVEGAPAVFVYEGDAVTQLPVVVDCHAEHRCPPCRALRPAIDELAVELADKAVIVCMNADENHEWAVALGIRSVPTLVFYIGGRAWIDLPAEFSVDCVREMILDGISKGRPE